MMRTSMYTYCRLVSLYLVLWPGWVAYAQEYIFDTEIINVEDGLPHRNAYSIVQDKEGYIWVSTIAGLGRYDGYGFKNYDPNFLKIPAENVAQYLAVDHANQLWYFGISTVRGVPNHSGIISNSRDSVFSIQSISGGRFTSENIAYLGNTPDALVIATKAGGIYLYDGDFRKIYHNRTSFTEDLLEIIGNSKEITNIQKFFSKMFAVTSTSTCCDMYIAIGHSSPTMNLNTS